MSDDNRSRSDGEDHTSTHNEQDELDRMRTQVEHMSKLLVRRDIDLMSKNESLKNLDQTKSEFVSIAAHQLRTPLTAIIWSAESLLHDKSLQLTQLQKKSLSHIHNSGLRMSELIGALLNVSRLELGTIEKKMAPTDVRAVVGKVVSNFESVIVAKELAIHVDVRMDQAITDTALFEMIFSNLLENAIKYTPPSGDVFVILSKDADHMTLTVRDTGQGIPLSEQDKVFGKFYRASNVSDGTSGTGLGLHIVQMATEKLGGSLALSSQLDKGTEFVISFPVATIDK